MHRLDNSELIDGILKTKIFTHSFDIFIKGLLHARHYFKS